MLIAQPILAQMPRRSGPVWGTPASLLLHGLVLAALSLLGIATRRVEAPEPPGVAIEMISAADFAALTHPVPDATELAPAPTIPAPPAVPADQPVKASRFFAADIVRTDRRIAAALPTLGNDERVVQLCNIEALEQIRVAAPQYDPDTMVAYAMADMLLRAKTLTAKGGAFRSRRRWYGIAFSCAVAADFSGVEAFQFTLGEAIPPAQWEAHNLTAAEAEE